MTDILKDIEDAATAADRARATLITWLCVAVILIVLGVWGAHHFEQRGRTLERAGWLEKELKDRAAVAVLVEQHHQDMNELEKQHLLIERKTSEDHENEIAQLRLERDADRRRADAAGGLRIPAPACPAGGPVQDGSGTEAPGAGGRDEASATTVRLPQQIENDLWSITDDADEVSAQLRACQGWIRANGFYGPKPADSVQLLDRMIAAPNPPAEENP